MQVARSPLVKGALGALALGFAVMYVWATALALQLSNLDILNKNKFYASLYGFVQLWPILFVILIGMSWKLRETNFGAVILVVCALIQLVWSIFMLIYGVNKDAPMHTILTKLKANAYDLYDCTGEDCKHEIDDFALNMIKFKTICDIVLFVLLPVFLRKVILVF